MRVRGVLGVQEMGAGGERWVIRVCVRNGCCEWELGALGVCVCKKWVLCVGVGCSGLGACER